MPTVDYGRFIAPWQASNNPPVTINANIGAGGNLVLVSAVAGLTVYLYGLWFVPSGNAVTLQDTTGVELGSAAGANIIVTINFCGAAITTGRGFQIHNGGGAVVSVNGMMSYTQA